MTSRALWPSPVLPTAAIVLTAGALATICPAKLRIWLLAGSFFFLGALESPEAPWLRQEPPVGGPAGGPTGGPAEVPVVLGVRTAPLAADCSELVTARIDRVAAGPRSFLGKRVLLRGLEKLDPPGGSCFTVCGDYSPPKPRLNPCGIDGRRQYARLGLIGAVDVTAIIARSGSAPVRWISDLRERFERLIRTSYPGEASGMLEAMLLGQRERLTPHVQTVMLRAGTYHVISVSGLHVGIVLLVFSAFLSVLRLPRSVLLGVYAAVTAGYVVFTGCPPSAVRAGGVFMVIGLVKLLQWKVDFPNTVCAAGTLLILAFPHFAWDIGFQLSLGAVLGMALLVPQLDWPAPRGTSLRARAVRYAATGFIVSIAAEALTLPIVLHDFGRASLVAPAANLVMVPLTTLAIAGGIEASFAMLASERIASILLKAAALATHASIVATERLSQLSWASTNAGRPDAAAMAIYFAGLGYICFFGAGLARRLKILLLVALHCFLIVPIPHGSPNCLRLTLIYVGDGDAILVEVPGGGNVLVDAGPNTEIYGQAQNQVIRLLTLKGINKIDRAIVTHPHDDHYGGLSALLDNVGVGEILVGGADGEPEYIKMIEKARSRGVTIRTIRSGDTWREGGATFEVMYPFADTPPVATEDANGRSVVVRLRFGSVCFVLTGDATPEVQRAILRQVASGSADRREQDAPGTVVLKAPHHGATNSLDATFLASLGARLAIVSAGSRFASHPSPSTLEMLGKAGLETLVTSASGAITLSTDGARLETTTETAREGRRGGMTVEGGRFGLTGPAPADRLAPETASFPDRKGRL